MMDINKLQTFVEVTRRKSFNAAAEQLFLTPATVSKHILSLENELQIKLFERSFNGVELTEDGCCFMGYAKEFLACYEKMKKEFSEKRQKGIVRLGVPSCQYFFDIPVLLNLFKEACPDIPFESLETKVSLLNETLMQSKCHIVFFIDYAFDSNLVECVPLRKENLAIAVHTDHPLAQREDISISELQHYDLISFPEEKQRYKLLVDVFHRSGAELNLKQTSLRDETILELVSMNKGVGVVASYCLKRGVVDYYGKGKVKILQIVEDTSWDFVMAKKRGVSLSYNENQFWKFVKHCVEMKTWPPEHDRI